MLDSPRPYAECDCGLQYREDRSLVTVILCDLKLRKFQLRVPFADEVLDSHLSSIEGALNSCKTKLNAALARSRIKACVLTVDHLLPESVRQNDKYAARMNVSAWVNFSKTTWVGNVVIIYCGRAITWSVISKTFTIDTWFGASEYL